MRAPSNRHAAPLALTGVSLFSWIMLLGVLAFTALNVVTALTAKRRADALKNQPLPALPGATGARITAAERALVYFFTPLCGACRPITPRVKTLAEQGQPVFAVDAMQDPALARALAVMATPTFVEVEHGRVRQVHVGRMPGEAWARYEAAATPRG